MIQDHYLTEDLDQLSDHLSLIHQATMTILDNATNANFIYTDDHLITLQKSLNVIIALHHKKTDYEKYELNELANYKLGSGL